MRRITTECADAALAIDPSIGMAYFAKAYVNDPSMTWAQRERLLLKSIEVEPDYHFAIGYLSVLLRYVGRGGEARLMSDRVPSDRIQHLRIRRIDLTEADIDAACAGGFHVRAESLYGYFGHGDAAYREIEKAFPDYAPNHFGNERARLFDPYMRVVRADPRFMPLAARLGLVDYWLETDHWPDFCTTEQIPYECKTAALAATHALAGDSAAR